MAETQGAASFNPDEASGLIDNVRATVKAIVVDIFSADSGFKGVNANVTYAPQGMPEFTERYLIGSAEEWAPNADKSGVLSLTGKKIWNKSEIFRLVTSFVNGGFPKEKVTDKLTVFVGSEVQLQRIADGTTYINKKSGQEQKRTTMLVTKVYELPKAGGAAKTTAASKGKAASTAAPAGDFDVDATLTDMLVGIVAEKGSVAKTGLAQPIFLAATKQKLSTQRAALQARAQDDAFLASLAEAGVIGFDGTTISAAA